MGSYFMDMQRELMKTVKERQEKWLHLFEPDPWFGEYIGSKEEFFADLYRTLLDEKNRRTFLIGKHFTTQFRCENMNVLNNKSDYFRFFTPAVFWHHQQRNKENMIWKMDITLDFDLTKDGSGRKYTPQELAQAIKNELGNYPNFVWTSRTKGNYQANFIIDPFACTPQSILYFEAIVKRLALILGADVASTNINHVFCVPHDDCWKFTDEVYNISDFEDVLEDEEIKTMLEERRKERNVISFTEKQIWNHPAIKNLMKAEFSQYRNNAAFTIALLFLALGKEQDEAFEFLNGDWFDWVNDGRFGSKRGPFRRKEVKSVVKSAFSGRYHGPSKEWIYLITGIEFPINLWKSTYVKKENGYQSADEVKRKIIDWVRENDGQTIKQSELIKELGVAERRFYERLNELKEEGIIEAKGGRGRHSKGTTFHFIAAATSPFVAEASYQENFEAVVDYQIAENLA